MSTYKLYYFEANGRATIPRAILSAAKAKWTNEKVKLENWPKLKKSGLCEFEQMPILEIDGNKTLAQSLAISLYLLKTFNLYGKDVDEQYQIDSLLCSFDEDLFTPLAEFIFCSDKKEREKLKKAFVEKYKFYLTKYEARYVALGKGKYFLGDHFSGADIYVASALPLFCHAIGTCIIKDHAPNLALLIERLKEGELKEYHTSVFDKNMPL